MSSELSFSSRRSPVVCLNGCVASSQPLASSIGLDVLKKGGNAADAAVAVAAALAVTEPCSTGAGGDCFCLFYDSKTKQVHGLNGSGRSSRDLTLAAIHRLGFSESEPIPPFHALNVTVPGTVAGWCDTVEQFGSKKLSLRDILQPAIDLAEGGFPVADITAYHWAKGAAALENSGMKLGGNFLIKNRPPKHGEVFTNVALGQTLKEIAQHGKRGFYEGRIAEAIVDIVLDNSGILCLEDLRSHGSARVTPIYTDYKGVRLWEIPPNGQGIAALIALNILENFSVKEMGHNSADYLHVLAEALKLSFSDTFRYCADPEKVKVPVEALLSREYCQQRSELIDMQKAIQHCKHGMSAGGDTVYFSVVDKEGNACSFINSNYRGFGTGLVPEGCGFTLQNRGAGFSLDPDHGNCVAPGKRPYHTIIPALVTDIETGGLLCSFGVMGAFMQPQGHVQVLLNMMEFGMNPQEALDAPRICVQYNPPGTWQVLVEEGVGQHVVGDLQSRGHQVLWPLSGHARSEFGRGQVIAEGNCWERPCEETNRAHRVLWAGSDPRADGCAVGY
ncbi:glutathione hydrolase-like YwrD proenzyme [Amia ocellicauda]|uniref:glutathione hydrolase-like YwrD proenzyme n=1 Tax=Amia ocellicauda TaxID=2972642 RepID=UPI0034641ADD